MAAERSLPTRSDPKRGDRLMRYRAADLVTFAKDLFAASGMADADARTVGEILVEADLMGHTTHGLQLAPAYLDELAKGNMRAHGQPAAVSHRKAAIVWDGRRLFGVCLTAAALRLAGKRGRD